MFKFIVAFHVCEDQDGDEEESHYESDVKDLVLCKDEAAVGEAIQGSRKREFDWAVFEVVGNKTKRCGVTFDTDGKTVKKIA